MGFLSGTWPCDKIFFWLTKLPAVEPIDFWQIPNLQKVVLVILVAVPYVDLELLKLFRLHRLPGARKFIGFSKATKSKGSAKVAKHTSKKQRRYGKVAAKGTENPRNATEKALNKNRKKVVDKAKEARSNQIEKAKKAGKQNRNANSNNRNNSNQNKRVMTDGGRGGKKKNSGGSGKKNTYKPIKPPENSGGILSKLNPFSGSSNSSSGSARHSRGNDTHNRVKKSRTFVDNSTTNKGGGGGHSVWTTLLGAGIGIILLLALIPAISSAAGLDTSSGPLAYSKYLDNIVDNNAAGVGAELGGAINQYQKAKSRVFCLFKGPACLRQYRMNNTQRPGSREVGQTYGLKIDNFRAGQGEQIDVAYKEPDYAFPVSFTISNPRHGLKGINAKNVSYRIRMVDQVGEMDDPNCDTGWIAIHNAYDIDEDGQKDDIFPGTAASTNFVKLDQEFETDTGAYYNSSGDHLTLEDCGMLQPSLGDSVTAVVDVKYNYFSQATLYFEAMARDTLESNSDIQISNKESVTADTPVKAAVNVNSPVIYTRDDNDRNSQPFSLRATLNTDKSDVEYKVRDLYVQNSQFIQRSGADNSEQRGACDFGNPDGGLIGTGDKMRPLVDENGDVYEPGRSYNNINPNSPAASMIDGLVEERADRGYYWFDSARSAPMFGCIMELSNPQEINPTGETLTVGVKSNYTVAKQDRLGSLSLQNNACTTLECPLLVTLQKDANEKDYDFKNRCTGLDAGNGCSVIEFGSLGSDWSDAQTQRWMANERPDNNKEGNPYTDFKLDSGEVAIDLSKIDGASNFEGTGAAGVEYGMWRRLDENLNGSVETPDRPYTIVQFKDGEGKWEVRLEQKCVEDGSKNAREGYRVVKRFGKDCTGSSSNTDTTSSSTDTTSSYNDNPGTCTGTHQAGCNE